MYSFAELNLLKAVCKGRATANGNLWRFGRMKARRHPTSNKFIGQAVLIDPSIEVFGIVLGECDAVPRLEVGGGPYAGSR